MMAGFFSSEKGEDVTLDIEGMSCQHCVGKVEKGLKEMPGVLSADVDLAKKQAKVRFNPEKLTIDDLAQRVSDVGFKVV
jgi:copper ion binding protein